LQLGVLRVEKQLGVLNEQLGILEVGAVVGIWIEDELGVGSVLLENVGVDGGHGQAGEEQ
jgi:hypothetical protein